MAWFVISLTALIDARPFGSSTLTVASALLRLMIEVAMSCLLLSKAWSLAMPPDVHATLICTWSYVAVVNRISSGPIGVPPLLKCDPLLKARKFGGL